MSQSNKKNWLDICSLNDVLPNMGCCALLKKNTELAKQVAIFRIISANGEEQFYALENYCPFSQANVISRGITGNINEKIVVASPIYKQHFDLKTGQCLEDATVSLKTYSIRLHGDTIQLAA